jgi:proline iminopeptidase
MPQHVRTSDGAGLWTAGSDGGPERPGMVFLHGGPGMWDYLGPVAAMADGRFRTHRYDQRGCGRSAPNDDHRMDRHVADLDELRRHFGHDRWYLFGHSFGATLGLHHTAAHADHVAGLVYCSGVGIDWPTHRAEYRARQAERLGAAQTRRRDELEQRERTWDEEVEWRTLCWLPDFADPATAHAHARADAETPLPLNLHCNRTLSAETSSWTRERELALCANVTAQVWLVHGAEDPRPVAGVAALAEALPTAELRVLPGVGHQPWRERPDLVRAVLDEVAEHATGGSRSAPRP